MEKIQKKRIAKANANLNESKNLTNKSNGHHKKKKDRIYSVRMQFDNKHKRAKSELSLNLRNKGNLLSLKQNAPKTSNNQMKSIPLLSLF